MANFSSIETIYVVEMRGVDTDEVVTLHNAYVTLEAAYEYIDECRALDERTDMSEWWTYRVKSFNLFR